jgi:UDP-N-acetyl-D-mannosaminuronic acid dehydrogenase
MVSWRETFQALANAVVLAAALERPGIFVLLVDHAAFRAVSRERLAGRHLVDTRGAWRGLSGK